MNALFFFLNEMCGGCGEYGGGGELRTGLWWGNERERDHLLDLDVNGRII